MSRANGRVDEAMASWLYQENDLTPEERTILRKILRVNPYSNGSLPGAIVGHTDKNYIYNSTSGILIPNQYGGPFGWAMINHVLYYGQSLSEGAYANPCISTSQPYNNLMFNTGVRTRDSSGNYLAPSSFVPLISTNDTDQIGETCVPGHCNEWSKRLYAISSTKYPYAQYQFLGSSAGLGGMGTSSLRPGTFNWDRLRNQMFAGRDIALAQNADYRCQGMIWMQGQADVSTNRFTYRDVMNEMQVELQRLSALTAGPGPNGQSHDCPIFATQTSEYATLNTQGSLLGLLDARGINSKIYITYPNYQFARPQNGNNMLNGDAVHGTAIGYYMMGAKNMQIQHIVCVDGNKNWKGVSIENITVRYNTIIIDYNVPVPPLTLDPGTLVGTIQDKGYKITDSTGVLTITSVDVVQGTRVRIVCNRDLVGTITLEYGLSYNFTGYTASSAGAGMLRDSDPFVVNYDDGGGSDPYYFPNFAESDKRIINYC